VTTYEVDVTAFGTASGSRKVQTAVLDEIAALVDSVPPDGGVIVVAALTSGVDHGNFYLFRNHSGLVHIMLHEHREHFARDPCVQPIGGAVVFHGEDGEIFSVPATSTTSWERGRAALLHWLPAQARWPELIWE